MNGVWPIVADDTNFQAVLIEAMQDSLPRHLMTTAGDTSRLVSFVERCDSVTEASDSQSR